MKLVEDEEDESRSEDDHDVDDNASLNSSFSSNSTNDLGLENLNSDSKLQEASNIQEYQKEVPMFLEHVPFPSDEIFSYNGLQSIAN